VALVGPFAADNAYTIQAMVGGYAWVPPPRAVVTVGDALRRRGVEVDVAVGSGAGVGGPAASEADFEAAVALARAPSTDAVIAVLGTTSCGCCVRCGNGEAGDRMSLELEGRQLELLAALVNASHVTARQSGRAAAPVIVVLIHGRPVSFEGGGPTAAGLERRRSERRSSGDGDDAVVGDSDVLLLGVDALLAAWRPGEEGGSAIVNLLFGDANPSGKLAQAWQRSAGFIHSPTSPWFQPHSSMTPGRYFGNGDGVPLLPLFPFGHGLSYTKFDFRGLRVDGARGLPPAAAGAQLEQLGLNVSLVVQNNGSRAGATPVIVTYSKVTRGVVRFDRETCAFAKVFLERGGSKRVVARVRISDLARWDPYHGPTAMAQDDGAPRTIASGAWVVDGGTYTFFAAGCVANSVLRDIHHAGDPSCPFFESAVVGKSVVIGRVESERQRRHEAQRHQEARRVLRVTGRGRLAAVASRRRGLRRCIHL